jgi:hypothetical protein
MNQYPDISTVEIDDLSSPRRFLGRGLTWRDYAETLKRLDGAWRQRSEPAPFGVFGLQPSWEDTIERGRVLFKSETWAELDDEQCSMLAPAHSFASGDALLGSIGRRSKDVRAFLFSPDQASDRESVLDLLKQAQQLPLSDVPGLGGNILARMCDFRGMGRGFATRLLTLARPDAFVVVNNKSVAWLRQATGLTLAGKQRTYSNLLRWMAGQEWYQSAEPSDALGRRLWRIRAALLDAFAYQPRD